MEERTARGRRGRGGSSGRPARPARKWLVSQWPRPSGTSGPGHCGCGHGGPPAAESGGAWPPPGTPHPMTPAMKGVCSSRLCSAWRWAVWARAGKGGVLGGRRGDWGGGRDPITTRGAREPRLRPPPELRWARGSPLRARRPWAGPAPSPPRATAAPAHLVLCPRHRVEGAGGSQLRVHALVYLQRPCGRGLEGGRAP